MTWIEFGWFAASFFLMFFAELLGTLHTYFMMAKKPYMVALMGGLASALWCIKIVVVMNQYSAIITAFFGAFSGTFVAYKLQRHLDKLNK